MKYRLEFSLAVFFPFLLFSLTIGCGPGRRNFQELDRLLWEEGTAALDSWDFSQFSSLWRRTLGDETSLAAALLLRESGREREARRVLQEILREGENPWREEAIWEFSSLLEDRAEWENLETLFREEINKGQTLGFIEGLYRVLANQGKLEILEGILAAGQEERPLFMAIAAVISRSDTLEERLMIAAGAKPAGRDFDQLWTLLKEGNRGSPAARLIEAKVALHRGEAEAASKELLALTANPAKLTPALVEDLVILYRKTSRLKEGAVLLEKFARNILGGKAERGRADPESLAFGAGRLYRWKGNRKKAAECFLLAFESTPVGEGERILWYLLDSLLRMDPSRAPDILSIYAPLWEDPSYFEDILDWLFSELIAMGEGKTILRTASLMEKYGSRTSRAQGAYLSARMGDLDWGIPLPPGKVEDLYRRALKLNPTGIYGWFSRYRLDEWDSLPGMVSPSEAMEAIQDIPLNFYLDLSLPDRARARWNRLNGTGSPADKWRVVAGFQKEGRYLDSLRFLGGIGAEAPLKAWKLRYPRGYQTLIEEVAGVNALPVPLLFALVRSESGFSADIKSWAGAVGLAQLMPATAGDMASQLGRPLGDLADPRENLELGGRYLRWLIDYVGAPWSAVLAYNGGPGRVRKWLEKGNFLPPDLAIEAVPLGETRNYGRNLLVAAIYYGYLYYGLNAKDMMAIYFDGDFP